MINLNREFSEKGEKLKNFLEFKIFLFYAKFSFIS
jgi:hypothetical protein